MNYRKPTMGICSSGGYDQYLKWLRGNVRYIKGADDMVLSRLAAGQDAAKAAVVSRVDAYATLGLRTLVYDYRDVSEAEYAAWRTAYDTAAAAMSNREAEKDKVSSAAQVREAVTSPGGVTEKGLAELEQAKVREAFAEAVRAVTEGGA